jgi:hypothetical protein
MTDKEKMLQILDFILNRSTYGDLEVIQEAIRRRTRDIRAGIAGIDVREIARHTAESIQKQIGSADEVTHMIRRFVRELITQQQPDISEEQLESLLDRCLPAPEGNDIESTGNDEKSGSIEERFPPDMIQSMLVQFIDYSLGRMDEDEKKNLAPDWQMRYWNTFSSGLKKLLSNLLKGKISEGSFWEEYKKK